MGKQLKKNRPIRSSYLPYGRQTFTQKEISKVVQVLKSDWITTGPVVEEFEKKFAGYIGARYAVSVNSGTAALHIACLALGLQPEQEVITTPFTFLATSNAILYCGAKPVFVDIDEETLNIDVKQIEKKITSKTAGILPVHFAGLPCDMDVIHKIAQKNKLWVLEDAAHALGARYKNRSIGNISDATIFSFHPVKNITTGEGGMVVTNNKKIYEKLLMYRTHGIRESAWARRGVFGNWHYNMKVLGFRFNMTEMQAALGVVQLEKLNAFQKKRREIVKKYTSLFKQFSDWRLPKENAGSVHGWHIYTPRWLKSHSTKSRDKFIALLRSENIGATLHYKPIYRHPYYQKKFKLNHKLFPVTEKVYKQILTLPLFPAMSNQDVLDVFHAVKKISKYYDGK